MLVTCAWIIFWKTCILYVSLKKTWILYFFLYLYVPKTYKYIKVKKLIWMIYHDACILKCNHS